MACRLFLLLLAGLLPAQAAPEVVGLARAEAGAQFVWQRLKTFECAHRRGPAPAGATVGPARPGWLWVVHGEQLLACDAATGARGETLPAPPGIPLRAACTLPDEGAVLAADEQGRILRFDGAAWHREWRWRPAGRVVGIAADCSRQRLFVAVEAAPERAILLTDLRCPAAVAVLAVPKCGCYRIRTLTGIAWDETLGMLLVTDGTTNLSARLEHEDGAPVLRLHEYCTAPAPVHGVAAVRERAVTLLRGEGAQRTIHAEGLQGPALLTLDGEVLLAAHASARLAVPAPLPRTAALLGRTLTPCFRTRTVLAEPALQVLR